MSAAGGSRTRPSATAATRPTRSTAAAGCCWPPRNASTPRATPSSKGCSAPATPRGKSRTRGTRRSGPVPLRHPNPDFAARYLDELARDLQDREFRPEVRQLGRTLKRWRNQIVVRHRSRATNGLAEAVNNLIKRVKRVAFGFRKFRHYRIRTLRHELLDRTIIWNERQLRRLVTDFLDHYNSHRPHRALDQHAPDDALGTVVEPPFGRDVERRTTCAGIINEYRTAA